MTKKELYATAKTLNIRGRSKMNKAQLERAIQMTTGQDAPQPKEIEVFDTNPVASLSQDQNLEKGQLVNFIHIDTRERGEMDVLFEDPSPNLYDDGGAEALLNELIELQERMATGMTMIKEMTSRRDKALQDYINNKYKFRLWMDRLENGEKRWATLSKAEQATKLYKYKAWKRKIWNNANPIKEARDQAYKAYQGHKEYLKTPAMADALSKLWDHWHALKDEGCDLAKAHNLWYKYFRLVEDENHLSFTGFDPEDIDTLKQLFDDTEHVKCLKDMHMVDQFAKPDHYEYERVEELPVRNYGYVPKVRDVTNEYNTPGDLVDQWAQLNEQLFSGDMEEEHPSYA